jgi:hypothetical protein
MPPHRVAAIDPRGSEAVESGCVPGPSGVVHELWTSQSCGGTPNESIPSSSALRRGRHWVRARDQVRAVATRPLLNPAGVPLVGLGCLLTMPGALLWSARPGSSGRCFPSAETPHWGGGLAFDANSGLAIGCHGVHRSLAVLRIGATSRAANASRSMTAAVVRSIFAAVMSSP